MIIITAGKKYIDIDAYASGIAYRELFKLKGIESKFVSDAVLNYSITESLKKIPYTIDNYSIKSDDKFIILDLSNKSYFPSFVNVDNIIEVIDHHPGFENYWNNKLGNKSIIESIGSVATIIVEKYEQDNLINKMNVDIAKLLMAAILDNTLNFTAKITTNRDKLAYKKLEQLTNEYDYAKKYFSECQKFIDSNLQKSIQNDIKFQKESKYIPYVFGQLTIWDEKTMISKIDTINEIMKKYSSDWILNIISLKDNSSYIICSDKIVVNKLEQLLDCDSNDNIVIKKPAMLRKEIMKKALLKEETYEEDSN